MRSDEANRARRVEPIPARKDRVVGWRFDLPHIHKSTLADAQRRFDPELIFPVIESAKKRLGWGRGLIGIEYELYRLFCVGCGLVSMGARDRHRRA